MALTGNEVLEGGFVRDGELGPLVLTTDTTGAEEQSGFLRDPDGRLVVVVLDA